MAPYPIISLPRTRIGITTEDLAFIKKPSTESPKPHVLLDFHNLLCGPASAGHLVVYTMEAHNNTLTRAPARMVPVSFLHLKTTEEARNAYSQLRDVLELIRSIGIEREWEHDVPHGVRSILLKALKLAGVLARQTSPVAYVVKIRLPKQMGGRTVVATGMCEQKFFELVVDGAYWNEGIVRPAAAHDARAAGENARVAGEEDEDEEDEDEDEGEDEDASMNG